MVLYLDHCIIGISYQRPKYHISKEKLKSECEKCNTIKVTYKDREVISRLPKNPYIILLRQGRGVGIMEKGKYTEKYRNILNTKEFCKLWKDSTKIIEMKIGRAGRKIKDKALQRSIEGYTQQADHQKSLPTARCTNIILSWQWGRL